MRDGPQFVVTQRRSTELMEPILGSGVDYLWATGGGTALTPGYLIAAPSGWLVLLKSALFFGGREDSEIREFVQRDGRQFTIIPAQDDHVAEDLVIEVAGE